MASLGQLNAGIVHDIQNPLNFVNNCCDVNKEMLEELKAQHSKSAGVRDEQAKTGIINDVRANEEKLITTQARRSYFKGMLQNSHECRWKGTDRYQRLG